MMSPASIASTLKTPRFEVLTAASVALAVAPSIAFRVRVTMAGAHLPRNAVVHALVLRARLRVEAQRRAYTHEEKARLRELFGTAEQWNATSRIPLSWAEIGTSLGRFERETTFDLVVPCTYDLAHATTKL